ncbi:ribosomal protein S18 [Chaetomium strumarium]|uniref:Small ribosomal subunit protein bS18m n=1 Tax=Chaetomium strumarium TaxID=1170767 RepID=A0AAJ0GZI5_9PEZI|nr:ribosomal protein S18 [Chaetomium strumarium]
MSCRQWLSSALRQCRNTFPDSAPGSSSGPALRSRNRAAARSGNINEALQVMVADGLERGGQLSAEEEQQVMVDSQRGLGQHLKDLRNHATTDNYLRQMPRRWRTGDVYAPRDLSPTEMSKWRQGRKPLKDVIDVFGFNPLDNYKNFSLISEFMTPMGRIKHSAETGLRPVNQRKMAKAIRRAVGMGLHPSVHRHPEVLRMSRHSMPVSSIPQSSDSSQSRL